MIKRCVEISSGPTHIMVRHNQLALMRDGEEIGRIPIEDLGVLLVDHPSVTYTHTALTALLANNVALVVCGGNHHPTGLVLPMEGHTVQAEAIARQASAAPRLKRRLWKGIVRAKITNQAHALEQAGREAGGLHALARMVKSGDPENKEAQAARRYWPLLFGSGFRRRRSGVAPNALLNYGYMVLRASVARAICGAGLHPSLGLHHRNKYNAFALADDLMEPFRPVVDITVFRLWEEGVRSLSPETKAELLGILSAPVDWEGQKSPLAIALHRSAASLRRVLSGEQKDLCLPRPFHTVSGTESR